MTKIKTSPYMPTDIEIEQVGDNRVKIMAYPFEDGYAITLAHPLRRLMMSSTVGYAPTAIKIEGVSHEFDSMRGMLEDVALFIINLKGIRFKLKEGVEKAVVKYSFAGPKEIYGSDLISEDVEIVTSEAYLATINEDAELVFTIIVEKGIGYVPSEEIRDNYEDGFIALDAFFTPVKKANYEIEKVLVEDNPNFEKIVFDIQTDGQITPSQAFKESLEAMYNQMSVFNGVLDIKVSAPEDSISANFDMKNLFASIDELKLSARSYNCLERANIKYIGELSLMSEAELKALKNLGKKSLDEVKSLMDETGYPVGYEFPEEVRVAIKKKLDEQKSNA
jgi:DNA-directed RNA polymerase subunit alpha